MGRSSKVSHARCLVRVLLSLTASTALCAVCTLGCHRSQSLAGADGGVSDSSVEAVSVPSASTPIGSALPTPTSLKGIASTIKTFKSKGQCEPLLGSATMPVALAKNTAPFFSAAAAAKGCECVQSEENPPSAFCSLTVTIAKRPPKTSDVFLDCIDSDGVFIDTLSFSADDFERHETGDKVRIDVVVQECWERSGVSLKLKIREPDTAVAANPASAPPNDPAPTPAAQATRTNSGSSSPRQSGATCTLWRNVGGGLVQGDMCWNKNPFKRGIAVGTCPCSSSPLPLSP